MSNNLINTVLAALRFYQVYLQNGRLPEGEQLKAIFDIAGDGADFASPEDIDDLCEALNCDGPDALKPEED